MTIQPEVPIPVTSVTGFLGAGKTTTILGLLKQLPKSYKVVMVKNEYGDVEVDSLLANQSQITGVSEILNGCLCCTMVGLVENALIEIKEKYRPDRIIIESSGSAFPATLALQIRQLEPQGFKLDGVVTVIDCVNFRGYEDRSPSAKLQAKYTDLLLLSKSHLCSERDLDILSDHLGDLNEDTPRVRVGPDAPLSPELVFGLDTKLFSLVDGERRDWEDENGKEGWHGDEVETRTVWTGKPPRSANSGKGKGKAVTGHIHEDGKECGDCKTDTNTAKAEHRDTKEVEQKQDGEAVTLVVPIGRETLEQQLSKLSFEIYRVKGLVRLLHPNDRGWTTYILNYAFGRHELHRAEELDGDEEMRGVGVRLTIMGERGEVGRRAKRFAEGLGIGAQCV